MTSDEEREDRFLDMQRIAAERRARIGLVYAQVIASLWLANGGAALAVMSFAAALIKGGSVPRHLLLPLWLFAGGLIAMGVGTMLWLLDQRCLTKKEEASDSLLDLAPTRVRRPSDEIGMSLHDKRTVFALISASFFIAGTIAGLLELTFSN